MAGLGSAWGSLPAYLKGLEGLWSCEGSPLACSRAQQQLLSWQRAPKERSDEDLLRTFREDLLRTSDEDLLRAFREDLLVKTRTEAARTRCEDPL
jgi:hypothetical protein